MALSPIVIQILTEGAVAASNILGGVGDDVKNLGDSASDAADGLKDVADAADGIDGGGASDAAEALSETAEAAEGAGEAVSDAVAELQEMSDKAGKVKAVGAAMAAIGIAGIALSNTLAEKGSDFVETQNLIKVSFKDNADGIEDWADQLNSSLGLSSIELQKNASTFNLMFTSMELGEERAVGMSKGLAMLANDMSSLYNIDVDAAFDKLKAGITGEAEPLKALGILLDEDRIKKVAYANGIAQLGEDLTEQQKVMARYVTIMEQTSEAHGDLAKTIDSPANAARAAAVRFTELQTAVGVGSANAQKNIDELTGKVLGLASANETVAEGAGTFLTYGSYALTAVGTVVTLAAQVAQLAIAFKISKLTQAEASATAAAAAVAEAGAVSTAGAATAVAGAEAAGAAAANTALAGAEVAVSEAAVAEAAAVTTAGAAAVAAGAEAGAAAVGHGALASAETAAGAAGVGAAAGVGTAGATAAASGAGAAAGAAGFGALAASIWATVSPILVLVAVAVAAAAAMYALDKAIHWKEDRANAANSEKGKEADKQYYEVEKKAAKKHGRKFEYSSFEDWRKKTGRGQEDAVFDASDRRDDGGLATPGAAVDVDALKKMVADAQAQPGAKFDPSIYGIDALQLGDLNAAGGGAATPAISGAEFEVNSAKGQTKKSVSEAQKDVEALEAEIQALQDKKRKASKEEKDAIGEQLIAKQRALKAAKDELSSAKDNANKAEERADKTRRAQSEIKQIQSGALYDVQISDLEDQLIDARDAKDSARVESLTYQIELAKASRAHERAMLEAAIIKDKTERANAIAVANAQFDGARSAAQRAGRRAGQGVEKEESKRVSDLEDRGEIGLQKIGIEGRAAGQIEALQDQLEEARDAKDAAKVEALTYQIEMVKASQRREEALLQASIIKDATERRYAEATAVTNFKNSEESAQRAASRARRAEEKAEGRESKKKKKGDKDVDVRDAAIRAQLAIGRSASVSLGGGNALGSNINYGDRFAEANALQPKYNVASSSFQRYNMNETPQLDISALPVPKVYGEEDNRATAQATQPRVEQNSRGEIVVKFDNITVPVPRIGDLRGRTGGRR